MKLDDLGCLERQQNSPGSPGATGDSCFDTSEADHMRQKIKVYWDRYKFRLDQFMINGKLQRHPNTIWMDDISSDQAHMYILDNRDNHLGEKAKLQIITNNYRTSNNNVVSLGLRAEINGWTWLSNLLLIGQIILFWIPIRWCDGDNPTVALGPIKLNLGYRHHCGDYRLFKQCLFYAPIYIKRLVSKKTLKKMTRYYWEPEPNVEWVIELDDSYVDML